MKIGILCAGDREATPFLSILEERRISEKAMLTVHEGRIHGAEVVVLFSGVCKVNAAIAAQILIDAYHADCIINAGTAGGIDPALDIFDTVIATETAYHDVAPHILTGFHPWLETPFFASDDKLLALSRRAVSRMDTAYRVYWGRMATGESFIADEGRQAIIDALHPLTVDMESAAVAHVCHVNRVPFIAIRTVTDNAAHSGTGHFEENCDRASAMARDITAALIREIRDGAAE